MVASRITIGRMRSPPAMLTLAAASEFGRDVVDEMDAEETLPIRLVRQRIVIDHFQIIDAVERAAADGVAPAFVATKIERHGRFAHARRGLLS